MLLEERACLLLLILLWISFSQHWLLGKTVEGFGASKESAGVVLDMSILTVSV